MTIKRIIKSATVSYMFNSRKRGSALYHFASCHVTSSKTSKIVYLTYESRNKKYIIMLSMIRKDVIVGTKICVGHDYSLWLPIITNNFIKRNGKYIVK